MACQEMDLGYVFRNGPHTGELVAALLERYRARPQTMLLALPRGGVPVAAVLVRELMLPLGVVPVHKLGARRPPVGYRGRFR